MTDQSQEISNATTPQSAVNTVQDAQQLPIDAVASTPPVSNFGLHEDPFPAGRIPEVPAPSMKEDTQPAMLKFLNPAAYKALESAFSSLKEVLVPMIQSLPFGKKGSDSATTQNQLPAAQQVSPMQQPQQSLSNSSMPHNIQTQNSNVVQSTQFPTTPNTQNNMQPVTSQPNQGSPMTSPQVSPPPPHSAMQTPPLSPPLAPPPSGNKSAAWTKIVFIVSVLIVVGGIGYGIFFFVNRGESSNPNNNDNNNDTTQSPSPTPFEINTTQPSIYSQDDVILQLEEDISALDGELSTTVLRESTLNPPILDFNISF